MLIFYVKALKDLGIFSMHGPCLCCIQNGGENQTYFRYENENKNENDFFSFIITKTKMIGFQKNENVIKIKMIPQKN